jgi:hypothetical protein
MKMILTVLALFMLVAVPGVAQATQIFSLDFNDFTPGTLLEAQGQGTGFTTRLAGTGGALNPAADANLLLDRRLGVLRMTSTDADLNGQRNLDTTEAIGINLSSLGFDGTQDFIVTAYYSKIPNNFPSDSNSFDQFGIFVGEDSAYLTRGGGTNYETFGALHWEEFGDNIFNGGKVDDAFFGPQPDQSTMTVEISRIGGVWRTLVNGDDRTPLVQPAFLDATDFTVGPWLYSTDSSQFMVDLDQFDVIVLPEPASVTLLLSTLCGLLVARRRH